MPLDPPVMIAWPASLRLTGFDAAAPSRVPLRPPLYLVTPAQAGVQEPTLRRVPWIPAFAGMTGNKMPRSLI
jgi:hypothetical protein